MGQRHLISLSIYLWHCFLKTLSSCYCSTFATKYRIKKKSSLNYHKSKKHAIWSTDLPNLIGHYSVVWWHPCKCLTFLVFWEQYSYISIVFYSPLLSPLVNLQPLFTYDINDGLLGKTSFSGVCSMEQPACWTWVKLMKVLEIGDQLNVLQEGDKHLTDYHTHLCYCHLRWLFSLFIFFLGVLPLLFVFPLTWLPSWARSFSEAVTIFSLDIMQRTVKSLNCFGIRARSRRCHGFLGLWNKTQRTPGHSEVASLCSQVLQLMNQFFGSSSSGLLSLLPFPKFYSSSELS